MSMCVNGVTSYRETVWYINRNHCPTFRQPNDENNVNMKAKHSLLRDVMKAKVKNIFVSGRSNNPKFIWWFYLFPIGVRFIKFKTVTKFVWFVLLTKICHHCTKSSCLCLFFNNLDGKKYPSVCRWSHFFLTFSVHLLTSTKLGT